MTSKLPFKLKIQLVHALILSKLDYCNSISYGTAKSSNGAVWVIFSKSKRSQVSHLLKFVHFLPVRFCIMYEINMLVYKCINNFAPV